MANHESKSSKSKEKLGIDPSQVQDDLELDIQKAIHENQVDIAKVLQPILTAIRTAPNQGNSRDDVARKYDAFLKSISEIMTNSNIISIDVGYFVDTHSYNMGDYGYLELKSDGLVANHCDGTFKVENVLDVLSDLHAPKQILRNLIRQIIEEINNNKWSISRLESCLESTEKAIKNFNITYEPNNRIANEKNKLN